MELPSHPEADDSAGHQEASTAATWATKAVIVLLAAILVVIVLLHLTGVVGPTAHG